MRLLVAGVVSILLAVLAVTAPVHAGATRCGSIVRPASDAWTADCTAYQRLLLAGGGTGLATGVVLVLAGRHQVRTANGEDGKPDPPAVRGGADGLGDDRGNAVDEPA